MIPALEQLVDRAAAVFMVDRAQIVRVGREYRSHREISAAGAVMYVVRTLWIPQPSLREIAVMLGRKEASSVKSAIGAIERHIAKQTPVGLLVIELARSPGSPPTAPRSRVSSMAEWQRPPGSTPLEDLAREIASLNPKFESGDRAFLVVETSRGWNVFIPAVLIVQKGDDTFWCYCGAGQIGLEAGRVTDLGPVITQLPESDLFKTYAEATAEARSRNALGGALADSPLFDEDALARMGQ